MVWWSRVSKGRVGRVGWGRGMGRRVWDKGRVGVG